MSVKTIKYKFKKKNTIGKKEIQSSIKVLKTGDLSGFMASRNHGFLGGPQVRKFEKKLEKFYNVKYAISVNSWTSGLITIIGSLDVEPGDEIIVTPWTMCATVTAILHWNCIPIFADINYEDYCIDPEIIKKKITNRTKAIIAVDIFGYPAQIDKIRSIIRGKNIKIISDNAQAPYAFYKNKISGTNSDIGGFSFNYHKHINTGEGGAIITNSKQLAQRSRLIRNHGEAAVLNNKKLLNNILGYNFRLGEIEAAIGIEQYKKLKKIISTRQKLCRKLTIGLSKLDGLVLPKESPQRTHNYYIYPITLSEKVLNKFSRSTIIKHLEMDGVQGLIAGYENVHKFPMIEHKIAYGTKGFPWNISKKNSKKSKIICKNAEKLHKKSFLGIEVCLYELSNKDIELIIRAFYKIWKKLGL